MEAACDVGPTTEIQAYYRHPPLPRIQGPMITTACVGILTRQASINVHLECIVPISQGPDD